MANRTGSISVYEIVTERIVAKLEAGVIPWHRPWGDYGAPMNLQARVSGRERFPAVCERF